MSDLYTLATATTLAISIWYMHRTKLFKGPVWDIAKGILLAYVIFVFINNVIMLLIAFANSVWYGIFGPY